MKSSKKNEIKVGIVSFVGLILLIIGLSLGQGLNVSVSEVEIKLRFPNSGGIQPTSPIVVNGVKRGYVKTVKNDNNSVLITASIDNVDDFKNDVSAKITILEITGGKKIEISPGIVKEKFNLNNEINGINAADLADIVSLVGELGNDAKSFLAKFETIADNLNKLLSNGKLTNDLQKIADNTAIITSDIKTFLDQNIKDLNITLKNIKSITSDLKVAINKYEPRVDTLTNNLNNLLNDANNLITSIKSTLSKVDNIAIDVKDITNEVKSGKGLANKIIYDSKFSAELDSSVKSLQELVDMIKQHGVNVNVRLGTRP